MLRRLGIILLCALPLAGHSSDEPVAEAFYLANTGVMVSRGESRVLFDPLFRNTYGVYDKVPADIEAAILAGDPPWHGIDAVFISHYHEDHFDPELILEMLRRQDGVELFAPAQAAEAVRSMAEETDSGVLDRVHGLGLELGEDPRRLTDGSLQVSAVRIPHEGWPDYHPNVENIVFRVTLDDATTVMHFGDADPNDLHFARDPEYWREHPPHLAMPPYWFFFSDEGRAILEDRIGALLSIGVHVPNDVPAAAAERPEKLRDVELFTEPGESRRIGN